ncbi:phosphopantetheine-binding protein [Paenibacillus sp. FSL L8-0644]|uniref:phosphopantetheine-binding protein n=1 Tax=Paenibacillus sp. FSL L8-0644 TaxID=2954523 RepID=UPI004046D290
MCVCRSLGGAEFAGSAQHTPAQTAGLYDPDLCRTTGSFRRHRTEKLTAKRCLRQEARLEGGTAYVAPRTPLEEQLVRIWQSVLNHPQIGIMDHFFEVGGHSLRATTLMAKIHQELNYAGAARYFPISDD